MTTARPQDRSELAFAPAPTAVRYLVLAGLATAMMSAYLTRVMSAATSTIQAELELPSDKMGHVLGGFALGYFIFQVPGGMLATRYGIRLVFPAIAVAWSMATVWVTLAHSEGSLHAARFALGVAQSGLVPCGAKAIADWFPVPRRGIASAVLGASMQVGGVTANGLTAVLIASAGWRNLYLIYALTGVVWAIAFYAIFRNRPSQHPWTNEAERDLIAKGREVRGANAGGGWQVAGGGGEGAETSGGSAARSGAREAGVASELSGGRSAGSRPMVLYSVTLVAIAAQAPFRAFTYEFFTTWYPTYIERAHKASVQTAGLLNMLPVAAFGLGAIVGGVLVDAVLVGTGSRWLSRSGTAAASLFLCALCTLSAILARDEVTATVVIALGMFLAGIAGPAAWAAVMDVSGRHTAVVAGVMNMTGNMGSYACPVVVGYLLKYLEGTSSPNWNLVLYLFVGINLAGSACWLLVNPNSPDVEKVVENVS